MKVLKAKQIRSYKKNIADILHLTRHVS